MIDTWVRRIRRRENSMTGKQGQVEFRFEAGGKESFGLGLANIGFFESQNFAQRPAEEIGKKLKEMLEG